MPLPPFFLQSGNQLRRISIIQGSTIRMWGPPSAAAPMAKFRYVLIRPRSQPLRIVRRLGTLRREPTSPMRFQRRNIWATNTQFDRAAQDIDG